MPSRRVLALPILAALLAPALAACQGAGGGAERPEPLPGLERAWEAEDVETFVAGEWDRPSLWTTDDLVVAVGGEARSPSVDVTALDRADGTARWTVPVDGRVCATSSDLTPDGLGAVLLATPGRPECTTVAAVDTAAGEVAWTVQLTGALAGDRQSIVPGLGVGATSVNVTAGCGRVVRLDPADGSVLETLGRTPDPLGPSACDTPGGVGGSWVAWTARRAGAATTLVRDTDVAGSVGEVWGAAGSRADARAPGAPGAVVNDVVSTDPVVLDRSDGDGRSLRAEDATGRGETVLGLRMSPGRVERFTPVAQADGVLVGTYGDQRLHALDLATGETLWERPADRFSPDRRLVGAHDGELIWVQAFRDPDAPGEDETWVTASDPRDPDEGRTLGAVREEFASAVGDLWFVRDGLLLTTATGLTAYPLGGAGPESSEGAAEGAAEEVAAEVTEVPDGFRYDLGDRDWAANDVRPDDAGAACRAVEDRTLAALGLRTDLPAPVSCTWSDRAGRAGSDQDDGGTASLRVDVTAHEPTADTSAAGVAHEVLQRPALLGTGRALALGDEARVATSAGLPLAVEAPYGETAGTWVDLVVRVDNVVVAVSASAGGDEAGLATRPRLEALEAAAVEAARAVLASLDRDVPAPGPGVDGPANGFPPAGLGGAGDGPAARRLVPGGRPRLLGYAPDGRVTVDAVRPPGEPYPESELLVQQEAVSPRLGLDAVEAAALRLDDLLTETGVSGDAVEEVDGLGDEAVLVTAAEAFGTRTLVVRDGNLLLSLRHRAGSDLTSDPATGPGRVTADLTALARRLLPR